MKVKCVKNNNGWHNLTMGKTYDVINIDINNYYIVDDVGDQYWCGKFRFKPLSEIRNETINKLLTDES